MTELTSEKSELFKGRHFNHLLIIQAVRWYVTYLRHEVASITVKTARAGLHPLFHLIRISVTVIVHDRASIVICDPNNHLIEIPHV